MLEMRIRGGPAFAADSAVWRIELPGDDRVWAFSDVQEVALLDPEVLVTDGFFGPPGQQMPIRGLRFVDLSGLTVSVPLPLDDARAVGEKLMSRKVDVAQHLPFDLRGRLPRG